ncbi:MAG: FG-GAP repeat domain-containing protein [Sandaracinaceae bacterium]
MNRWMVSSACVALLLVSGCDCDGSTPPPPECTSASECESGELCRDGTCVPPVGCEDETDCLATEVCEAGLCRPRPMPDGGMPEDAGPPPECAVDGDCDEARCIDGACCESACGDVCCGSTETCFANACVTPGAVCVRAGDCASGEYCEPALGAPPGDPPSLECLSPPPSGRCLALPPTCEGTPAPGETCVRECEFTPTCATPHPTEAGVCLIDAVESWRWGPAADEYTDDTDVWSTPVVGRVTDTNCDGSIDLLDPPNLVFVSGNTQRVDFGDGSMTGTCCHCGNDETGTRVRDGCRRGVLRILDGRTGTELRSIVAAETGGQGISGVTPALGDVDHDGDVEIVVITYEGHVAVIEGDGTVSAISPETVDQFEGASCTTDSDCNRASDGRPTGDCFEGQCVPIAFGWGGGIALADADGDGTVEAAYGRTVFEIAADGSTVTREWVGTNGRGGTYSLSYYVNLDETPELELLAGRTAYRADGTELWHRDNLADTYTAVADFDGDGDPEIVHIGRNPGTPSGEPGQLTVLDAATGTTLVGPQPAAGTGSGGPPTVADFDGDGAPEVGVALQQFYSMYDVVLGDTPAISEVWRTPSHDLSSSITGSTVFDFEGDGIAEVIYNDECFVWVYDGPTGTVRFAAPTTSFTGTEASLVADVDGDGQAEMVAIANGADPRSPSGWDCDVAPWNEPGPNGIRPAWVAPEGENAWRGVAVYGDRANSWVGTRPLWNQHSYSVSNVCSADDDACTPAGTHGAIPTARRNNWSVPWLNNYRQNVQADGLFSAADAALLLAFDCNRTTPALVATLRNLGEAVMPAGVEVAFFVVESGTEREIGRAMSGSPLFPGQGATLVVDVPSDVVIDGTVEGVARVVLDPDMPLFQECFDDNNEARAPLDASTCIL